MSGDVSGDVSGDGRVSDEARRWREKAEDLERSVRHWREKAEDLERSVRHWRAIAETQGWIVKTLEEYVEDREGAGGIRCGWESSS